MTEKLRENTQIITSTHKIARGDTTTSLTQALIVMSLVWSLGTSIYYPAFKKTVRAREAVHSLEITDAQRRILDEYRRVMGELNFQINELSEWEFSIENEPPTVHWINIPLYKPKTQNSLHLGSKWTPTSPTNKTD
jgi:hypothetical protein